MIGRSGAERQEADCLEFSQAEGNFQALLNMPKDGSQSKLTSFFIMLIVSQSFKISQ